MTQDIPLDKPSIKSDCFQHLKSLPVELFNKIVELFRIDQLVKLHDEAPGSDRFNDQIYALTLKTLIIKDSLTIDDEGDEDDNEDGVYPPAKFYGNGKVFCWNDPSSFSLDIRYISEFPEHLKQYVKNIEMDYVCGMYRDNIKETQGSVASFVNSFPQLDMLSIMTPYLKFQDKIVVQVKELECYVYDNVLDNFSTENLETLKLELELYGDSTVAIPKYKPYSVEFLQKLGEYRLPKLHTLKFLWYLSPAYWKIDFQYFKNMPQLTTCFFRTCKVLNLREEYAQKLQSVTTHYSYIDKIALPQLTTFNNIGLKGRVTEKYGSLKHLTTLKLVNCGLSSAKMVSNLQHLKSLDLSRNNITAITGLENMPFLGELWLRHNKLTSLAGLSGLTNLNVLYVSYNRDLHALGDALSRCHKLEYLGLGGCGIEELEGLDNLRRLEWLDVYNNRLTVLDNLNDQKQSLKTLDASTNNISSITQDFSQFSTLENLRLKENKITSFENINCIPELKRLNLRLNPVASVDRLLSYPKLESFDISKTRITSMEGLEGVEKQVPEVRTQIEKNL